MARAAFVLSSGDLWHSCARRRARRVALVRPAALPAAAGWLCATSGIAVLYANRAFSMDDSHRSVALHQACRSARMAETARSVLMASEIIFTRMIVFAEMFRLSLRAQTACAL